MIKIGLVISNYKNIPGTWYRVCTRYDIPGIQQTSTDRGGVCFINGRDKRGVVYHTCDFSREVSCHTPSEWGTKTRDLTKQNTGRACGCIAKPCWLLMFTVNADFWAAPVCSGKTIPTHAAELRDCPCRPRAAQRVRVEVRLGLWLALRSDWSGLTCNIEVDHKRQAGRLLPARPAVGGGRYLGGVILIAR